MKFIHHAGMLTRIVICNLYIMQTCDQEGDMNNPKYCPLIVGDERNRDVAIMQRLTERRTEIAEWRYGVRLEGYMVGEKNLYSSGEVNGGSREVQEQTGKHIVTAGKYIIGVGVKGRRQ